MAQCHLECSLPVLNPRLSAMQCVGRVCCRISLMPCRFFSQSGFYCFPSLTKNKLSKYEFDVRFGGLHVCYIPPFSVFQITFKGRVPTRNFEGSIDVDLPTPSQVYHLFCRVRWPAFSGFLTQDPSLIWNTAFSFLHINELSKFKFDLRCGATCLLVI